MAELAAGASTLPRPCRRGWLRGAVTSAACNSDDGPQLGRAPTTTTRTGFCSSWCSQGTSSRRPCGGSSEQSPRWQPQAPRVPRTGELAAADRICLPSTLRRCTDPGPWRRKEAAARTLRRPTYPNLELKPPLPFLERPPRLQGGAWKDYPSREVSGPGKTVGENLSVKKYAGLGAFVSREN